MIFSQTFRIADHDFEPMYQYAIKELALHKQVVTRAKPGTKAFKTAVVKLLVDMVMGNHFCGLVGDCRKAKLRNDANELREHINNLAIGVAFHEGMPKAGDLEYIP